MCGTKSQRRSSKHSNTTIEMNDGGTLVNVKEERGLLE